MIPSSKPVFRICDGMFLLIKDGKYRKFLYADILYVEASGSNQFTHRGVGETMVGKEGIEKF